MRYGKAFSPAHITGFFTIQDASVYPEQSGSTGAGFCISAGTLTRVVRRSARKKTVVKINGSVADAPVSLKTVSLFFETAGLCPEPLSVRHYVSAPQGAGFGTSGSGALSLAFALNRLYGFPLSEDRAAAVAHSADVLCKTGLGTVVGERKGGFELRLKPGTPPYGEIDGFSPERPLYAVFVLFGPLSTVGSLSDPKIRADINRNGEAHLQRLREEPTPERFLEEASHFSEEVNLFSQNGLKAADLIRKLGYRPAMLMFGDGIYTFCNTRKEAQNLRKILKKNFKNDILISKICSRGARIL